MWIFSEPILNRCFTNPGTLGMGTFFWTGGHRLPKPKSDTFAWIKSSPYGDQLYLLTYTNWWKKEPDNARGVQSCIAFCSNRFYKWNDFFCYAKTCSVCEIDIWLHIRAHIAFRTFVWESIRNFMSKLINYHNTYLLLKSIVTLVEVIDYDVWINYSLRNVCVSVW